MVSYRKLRRENEGRKQKADFCFYNSLQEAPEKSAGFAPMAKAIPLVGSFFIGYRNGKSSN